MSYLAWGDQLIDFLNVLWDAGNAVFYFIRL